MLSRESKKKVELEISFVARGYRGMAVFVGYCRLLSLLAVEISGIDLYGLIAAFIAFTSTHFATLVLPESTEIMFSFFPRGTLRPITGKNSSVYHSLLVGEFA
jgi:hypothetical protein